MPPSHTVPDDGGPANPNDKKLGPSAAAATGSSPADAEFVAVILAASAGARLFPLTSDGDDDDDFNDGDFGGDGGDHIETDGKDDGAAGSGPAAAAAAAAASASEDGADDDADAGAARTVPKHLLPLAGSTVLRRLLASVHSAGFARCVVAVSAGDGGATVESLLSEGGICRAAAGKDGEGGGGGGGGGVDGPTELRLEGGGKDAGGKGGRLSGMSVSVVPLDSGCAGSADAVRYLSSSALLPRDSHLVVLPGDLVLGPGAAEQSLRLLVDAHRRGQQQSHHQQAQALRQQHGFSPPACTVLLSDVGDEDEGGIPLKESAKAKKGGLARDEEDIEFIGLSPLPAAPSPHQPSTPRRVILKQSKIAVEEDEGTGSTPKLVLPKGWFHHPGGPRMATVRTDLNDLHAYAISPWVVRLLSVRTGLSSIQKEILPLLVSRQFRGVRAAFGSASLEKPEGAEALGDVLASAPFSGSVRGGGRGRGEGGSSRGGGGAASGGERGGSRLPLSSSSSSSSPPFAVYAQVLPRDVSRLTLRACTVPSYLYGCREVVAGAVKAGPAVYKPFLPDGTQVNAKFQSVLLPGSTVGDKVTVKASTVGKDAKVGNRCRLNNVIVMDGATVGANCVLQNSVLGSGSTVGENCNLNDCQIGPGADVPSGTKEKGESFMR